MSVMLPAAFTARMEKLLGKDYETFLKSYEETRKYALRVNTLKISPEEFVQIAPFHLTKVPWIDNAFYYEEEDAPARHPFYYAGLYYLQEPSAMTPASVLAPQKGERVLDLCAAPGGKATALAAMLGGEGLLVANDISASRCRALLKNLELFGTVNAFVTNAVPARLAEQFPGWFDSVLLDAPCSGEGMFRKDENTIRAWYPEKNAECAKIQKDLILRSADMLRPGGRLLYSTCTFAPEENEEVIQHLLSQRPDMQLCSIPHREGFSAGLCGLDKCVRLWPHIAGGEGHFLALLQKDGSASEKIGTADEAEERRSQMPKSAVKEKKMAGKKGGTRAQAPRPDARIEQFFEQTGIKSERISGWLEKTQIRGTQVYFDTAYRGEAKGIPFVRNGLYAGELKKDRFEPSQELAMALARSECSLVLNLPAEDERLMRYLKGETISYIPEEIKAKQAKGWVLICAAGYPLGWGKAGGGLIKNKYHTGWRNN